MRLALILAFLPLPALAGEVEIVGARATMEPGGWRFDVTIRHADTGWEHYADEWRIVGPGGVVYGSRRLLHPHVDEQPFTRKLSRVAIPEGVTRVEIEAHDNVHGWSPKILELPLPR